MSFIFDQLAPQTYVSKDALNHLLVYFSKKKNSLRSAKNVVFSLSAFWSTVQVHRPTAFWSTGQWEGPTRQNSHLIALFEVFYNLGKIILP